MNLSLLERRFAVCRLPVDAPVPAFAQQASDFVSITRTRQELSLVCREELAPANCSPETGWRVLEVQGPLDFGLVGILASLTQPLAQAGISLFVVSTFDTDYLLVKETKLEEALRTLEAAGHSVRR